MGAQGGQGVTEKFIEAFPLGEVVVEDLSAGVFSSCFLPLAIAKGGSLVDIIGWVREDHVRPGAVHQ